MSLANRSNGVGSFIKKSLVCFIFHELENESELRSTAEEDSERVEEEVVEESGEGSDDELAEHSATEKTAGTASPIPPKKV